MSLIEAILLGIIQGLTEFLPVSSSGHIEIAQKLLGADDLKEQEELLSVVLHAATALSTLVVFRKDILEIFQGLVRKQKTEIIFSIAIIISMIPAVFIGLKFDMIIAAFFEGDLLLVGSMLLITALLLYLADKAKSTEKSVTPAKAFMIGISQAIAILPGISRSGATISTSVLLGVDRAKAARFSFLMVVPLILGKMTKDILDGKLILTSDLAIPLSMGFLASFITGIIACLWMIKLVKQTKLKWFALYCIIIGVISISFSL